MAKRFTESEKWRDSWFAGLSSTEKLKWFYLCDACDSAGVFDVVPQNDTAALGERVDWDAFILRTEGRVERLSANKLWLVRFCDFQYPRGLKETVKAHAPILRSIAKHGLSERLSVKNPKTRQRVQDKDKETEKDKEREIVYPGPLQGVVAEWLEYKRERSEGYTTTGLKQLHGRVRNLETEHGAEAVESAMRRAMANGWKGFDYDVGKRTATQPTTRTQGAVERFVARHGGADHIEGNGNRLALRGPR